MTKCYEKSPESKLKRCKNCGKTKEKHLEISGEYVCINTSDEQSIDASTELFKFIAEQFNSLTLGQTIEGHITTESLVRELMHTRQRLANLLHDLADMKAHVIALTLQLSPEEVKIHQEIVKEQLQGMLSMFKDQMKNQKKETPNIIIPKQDPFSRN